MDDLPVTLMSTRRQRGKSSLCFVLSVGIAVTVLLFGARAELFASAVDRPFRLAFTSSMFAEVNENDVRAAMKVWIMTVAQERGIPVDPDPNIHRTVEDLMRFARTQPVDGFGITTPEYVVLSKEMLFDSFAAGVIGGEMTDVYILLVRQDSGLERLDQLAGRSLSVVDSPHMSLAVIWLDIALLEAKLKRTSDFFKKVTVDRKVSQVVLPVFFGKVDACLVTRDSFEVMCALNPQLEKQLRILSTSPPVVTGGFFFRRDSTSSSRQQILDSLTRLGASPAGRQILNLTQSEAIDVVSISCLDESLELLNRHRRLLGD